MTIFSSVLAILGFIGVIAAHEIGHAVVLRKLGYPIKEIGLGLPFGPRIVLKPTPKREYALSLSPFLVMAYVRPEEEDHDKIESGPYKDYAWFSGVGIIVNVAIGAELLAIYRFIQGDHKKAAILLAVALITVIARKFIVRYVVPAIAVPIAVLIFWSISKSVIDWLNRVPSQHSDKAFVVQFLIVDTPLKALAAVGAISLVLGIANALPMRPLDGGRICQAVVTHWLGLTAGKKYLAYSFAVGLGLEVFATLFYITRMIIP